jgi:hypothetical protein
LSGDVAIRVGDGELLLNRVHEYLAYQVIVVGVQAQDRDVYGISVQQWIAIVAGHGLQAPPARGACGVKGKHRL